jgi:hypothetical protein
MIRFWTGDLFGLLKLLEGQEAFAASKPPGDKLTVDEKKAIHNLLKCVQIRLFQTDLRISNARINEFTVQKMPTTDTDCTYQIMRSEISGILHAIERELKEHHFAYIPITLAGCFENKDFLGDTVYEHFYSARADIKDAGNCVAAGLNTAAVFHLMRVVNIGLRTLAKSVGVKRIDGKKLEYCRDESIIKKVGKEIDKKLESVESIKRGEKWENKKALYQGLLVDLQYFKDAVRDPMAHARKNYTEAGAMDVYDHVKNFMQRLDKHLFPVKKTQNSRGHSSGHQWAISSPSNS